MNRRALPAPPPPAATLDAVDAPVSRAERVLAAVWRQVFHLDHIGVHDNFFALGGDSILAIQVIARANQAGLDLRPRQLFEHQTIAALARAVPLADRLPAPQEALTGPVPLTPTQHTFFEQPLPQRDHFNQAVFLGAPALDPIALDRCARALVRHHDALRLRFDLEHGQWRQSYSDAEGQVFISIDLAAVPEVRQTPAVESAARVLQASLNLARGPVMRAAHFHLGGAAGDRLLIVIHHLAVDAVSWRVLLEDLDTLYRQAQRRQPLRLPPKTNSYRQWSEALAALANSEPVRQERRAWLTQAREQSREWGHHLPRDVAGGANTVASERTVRRLLTADRTAALLRAPAASQVGVRDLLLTGLAEALAAWTGQFEWLVEMEDHGRVEELVAGIDLSRTVGWFTCFYPFALRYSADASPVDAARAIAAALRSIEPRRMTYGLLRYLADDAPDAGSLRALPALEIRFNYLGVFDALFPDTSPFGPCAESAGPWRAASGSRTHVIEIDCAIVERQLRVDVRYSANLHRAATIETFADQVMRFVNVLIDRSHAPGADVALASLKDGELRTILDELSLSEQVR